MEFLGIWYVLTKECESSLEQLLVGYTFWKAFNNKLGETSTFVYTFCYWIK